MRALIVLGLLLGSLPLSAEPLLVLLTETGKERDGLPVLAVHPGAAETAAGLTRGVSGALLRVYGMLQTLRQAEEGVPPEPAYVLLSTRQGGFARLGFWLGDEDKSFPDEAPFVDAVAAEVFLGQPPQTADEIWLANPAFETGTTLFDQYRGLPRVHTFDLNAASPADLAGVPGVGPELARAIRSGAPYASVDGLAAVPGVDAALVARFQELRRERSELRETFGEDDEDDISISALLMPFVWRGVAVLAAAAVLGSVLYRIVRSYGPTTPPSWWRTVLNGLAAALLGAAANWAVDGMGWSSLVAVGVVFGLPGALWCFRKTRRAPAAWNVLAAWLAASLPAVALTTAWG